MILWLVAVFFLAGFVLFAPLMFSVSFSLPDAKKVFLRLWGGAVTVRVDGDRSRLGLLGLEFKSDPAKPPGMSEAPKKEPSGKPHKKSDKSKAGKPAIRFMPAVRILLGQKVLMHKWLEAVGKCLKRIPGIVRFQALQADLRVGLSDPAQVGYVMGIWNAIDYVRMDRPAFARIRLAPDFREKQVSGTLQVTGHTSLFRLLFPVAELVLHAPLLRSFFLWRRLRAASS